jgi:hypothetical protein
MNPNINNTIVLLNILASGLKKNQSKGSFSIAGAKFTASQLVMILQSIVTAMEAVLPAKGTYLLRAYPPKVDWDGVARGEGRRGRKGQSDPSGEAHDGVEAEGENHRGYGRGDGSPKLRLHGQHEQRRATKRNAHRDARSLKQSGKKSRASSGLGPGGARAFVGLGYGLNLRSRARVERRTHPGENTTRRLHA